MIRPIITCMKLVLPYLCSIATDYTYVCSYIYTYIELGILFTFNTRMHAVCSLCMDIKRGILVSYRYSCIALTYIYIRSMDTKLTKNACYKSIQYTQLTGLCMQELQCMYVAIYRHATWWLINHDAHEASSYIIDMHTAS